MRPALPLLGAVAGTSIFINLLRLTIPLYMIQVIDRVLSSESRETLVFITLIAAAALLTHALLSGAMQVLQARIGAWLDERLFPPLANARLSPGPVARPGQPNGLREAGRLRQFFTSPTLSTLLEAPWTVVFVAILFLLHPTIGSLALVAALVLLALAVADAVLVQGRRRKAEDQKGAAAMAVAGAAAGGEALRAMGMSEPMMRRLVAQNLQASAMLDRATQRGAALQSGTRFLRMLAQVAVLGAGGYLVLQGEITTGTMIAGSILLGLALSPIDKAVGAISVVREVIRSAGAVDADLSRPAEGSGTAAPARDGGVTLTLRQAMAMPQGARRPILRPVTLDLAPGRMLGVIGPVAAGKTTLARMIVGAMRPTNGSVHLNGVDAHRAFGPEMGALTGYVPQQPPFFDGTIGQNIARFDETGDPVDTARRVSEAAVLAGVHEAILALPQRYDTVMDRGGQSPLMSRGQVQQVALARAFYGGPRLLVLDEPATGLDKAGEMALVAALKRLREGGATIVVVSQRPGIVQVCDQLLHLRDGNVVDLGPPERVIARLGEGEVQGRPRRLPEGGGARRA